MVPIRACVPSGVAELLRRQPLSPAKVAFAWRAAVGPAVDRATAIRLRDDGVLEVRTEGVVWRQELKRSADLVRGRLATLLGPDTVRWIVMTNDP